MDQPAADEQKRFVELLVALRSGDNSVRLAAEKTYAEALRAEPLRSFACMLGCIDPSAVGSEEVLRTQAVTLLRRAVIQVGPAATPWDGLGAQAQQQARHALLRALSSEPSHSTRRVLVAAVAAAAASSGERTWTELVPQIFVLASAGDEGSQQESALRLLTELMGTSYTLDIMEKRNELGMLVLNALSSPKLRASALGLVAEMVSALDSDSCQALQPALPKIEEALRGLSDTDHSAFEDALQSLIACAVDKASFFKPRYAEWVDMMLKFASSRGVLEDGIRSLAMEFVSTLAESKSKVLLKAVPTLPQLVLNMAFAFLSEIEEDDSWSGVNEEEEEDDDDTLHKTGEAKVDFFVRKLGFDATRQPLQALLQQCGTSGRWQERLAAAMAIRASAEYVTDDTSIDGMATLLLQLVKDSHMRVRYAALFALGQMCHDLDASFPARWHPRLVPVLIEACADTVDRVSAKAASSLEAAIGELDEGVLSEHAPQILQAFLARLTSSTHSGVLVTVMEALGALAVGLEGSFGDYYDQLMSLLLTVVGQQSSSPMASRLRGKAFECISLLGFSVGKERFAPAAQQTMSAMLAAGATSADDFQTDCIREAMERMCKTMGQDFAAFLPTLLPSILASLQVDALVQQATEEDADASADRATEGDDLVLPTDDGFVKVNTGHLTEMLSVVSLLNVLIRETGIGFFDYARPVAEALAKILSCTDFVLTVASSVRDAVYPCWADLVEVMSKAVASRGSAAQALVVELVRQFVDKVGADLARAEDPEDIAPMANGIASVVRNAGAGCLEPTQVQGISSLALSEIMKSLQRESVEKAGDSQLQGFAAEDEDDDDDEGGIDLKELGLEETDEQDARLALCGIFGACLKASPDTFISQSLPTLRPLMEQWLGQEGPCRALGLHLACDLCEHLGEKAAEAWPTFMDKVLESLLSKEAEERNTSAFTVLLAAQVQQFGSMYGTRAYNALGASLQRFKAKKSNEDSQRATDNAVAALCQLCLCHPGVSPDLDGSWQAIFARLPLRVDLEESQRLNRKLFTEAQKPNGGSLGSMTRVAQVLGHLCEVYGRSEHCDEDLQRDLCAAFASLPQGTLESLVGQFSAKQQKKAERIVSDGLKAGSRSS
mmetsp:Transcript_37718/g.94659  ORF Transcript_37718/g.94659 Transcript_37718/m.94659 type:complete len:1123 (+) Transcript_37718:58-3426(+)